MFIFKKKNPLTEHERNQFGLNSPELKEKTLFVRV